MSGIEKRNEWRPESGEAPFDFHEVLYSRTDERGVIQAGNYVFRRVTAYDWPELIGAPHRLIRHPDMPKGVFWLMWDRIKRGEAIGAYVKNRARDGLFYWVFAVVAPLADGGYLSARIKPSTEIFGQIEQEYASLLAAETAEGLTPEQSAGRLIARLAALGFADYGRFAAHTLSEELTARDTALGAKPDPQAVAFREVFVAAEQLRRETDALIHEFELMRTVPHNMRVIASRLEPTGGPVSTLSKNYGAISQEMSDWFNANIGGNSSIFGTILSSVNTSMFIEGVVRILQECESQLQRERRSLGGVDLNTERAIMSAQVAAYRSRSSRDLATVREQATRILAACNTMNRHVLGLSSTRVLCKIEAARTAGAAEGLADIIVQLGTFQERISERLASIAGRSVRILALIG